MICPAPPVGVPVVEGEHHRVGAGEPGDAVGEPERRQRGRSGFLPGLVGQPGHRLGQGAEGAALGVRPGLAEPGDPQHHQGWVDLLQIRRAESPFLQHSGAEVLDHHVGLGDQAAQDVLTLGFAEVQGDGPLVAGDDLPPQAVAVLGQAVGAGGIAAGMLDLDDVGAPVAEQHRGDRSGVDGSQVQHPQPGERAVGWDGSAGGAGSFGGGGGGRHARLVLLGLGACTFRLRRWCGSSKIDRNAQGGLGAARWGTGGGQSRRRGSGWGGSSCGTGLFVVAEQ